jgi:hypothetical protein
MKKDTFWNCSLGITVAALNSFSCKYDQALALSSRAHPLTSYSHISKYCSSLMGLRQHAWPPPKVEPVCCICHILEGSTNSEKECSLLVPHYKLLESHGTFERVMERTVNIWWSDKYYKYGPRQTAGPVLNWQHNKEVWSECWRSRQNSTEEVCRVQNRRAKNGVITMQTETS